MKPIESLDYIHKKSVNGLNTSSKLSKDCIGVLPLRLSVLILKIWSLLVRQFLKCLTDVTVLHKDFSYSSSCLFTKIVILLFRIVGLK